MTERACYNAVFRNCEVQYFDKASLYCTNRLQLCDSLEMYDKFSSLDFFINFMKFWGKK